MPRVRLCVTSKPDRPSPWRQQSSLTCLARAKHEPCTSPGCTVARACSRPCSRPCFGCRAPALSCRLAYVLQVFPHFFACRGGKVCLQYACKHMTHCMMYHATQPLGIKCSQLPVLYKQWLFVRDESVHYLQGKPEEYSSTPSRLPRVTSLYRHHHLSTCTSANEQLQVNALLHRSTFALLSTAEHGPHITQAVLLQLPLVDCPVVGPFEAFLLPGNLKEVSLCAENIDCCGGRQCHSRPGEAYMQAFVATPPAQRRHPPAPELVAQGAASRRGVVVPRLTSAALFVRGTWCSGSLRRRGSHSLPANAATWEWHEVGRHSGVGVALHVKLG